MKLPKLKVPAFAARFVPSADTLKRSWTRWLGYPAFFGAAFWLCLYATFPNDALRDRIAAEARQRLGTEVQIGSVRLAGISGVTLRDVSWVADDAAASPSPAPAAAAAPAGEGEKKEGEQAEGEAAPAEAQPAAPAHDGRVVLDQVTAKAKLFSLLAGNRAFTFDIDAWGGNVAGVYEAGGESLEVKARLKGVDLARSPLRALAGVDLAGKLSAIDVELTADGEDLTKANGSVTLKGEELQLRGGDVQGVELPAMALGTLDGAITVNNGKATFEKFELKGQDLQAELDGYVRLSSRLKFSTLSGKLRLKPSDEWWNKNEMLKGMANLALPEGKDGWRTVGLYGQLAKPNFRPQR
jgi:type II secretion system protein N